MCFGADVAIAFFSTKLLRSFFLFFDLDFDTAVFSTVLEIMLDVVVVLPGQYIEVYTRQ